MSKSLSKKIQKVARAIQQADAILFTAGAGMGVDSGLPDFRGVEGFWKAYPPMQKLNYTLPQVSTPKWFQSNPEFAFGFWAHRHRLYSNTAHHQGFEILRQWSMEKNYFVFTSNVDGHFSRVFPHEKIIECHGTVDFLQCSRGTTSECRSTIWPSKEQFDAIEFDSETFLANADTLPRCVVCKSAVARPNVLMFGDSDFLDDRTDEQWNRFREFTDDVAIDKQKLVVIEIGAGEFVPTVRHIGESTVAANSKQGSLLVRINPRDTDVPNGHISLPLTALDALQQIQTQLDLLKK